MKKTVSCLLSIFIFLNLFSYSASADIIPADGEDKATSLTRSEGEYTIYPLPQKVAYSDTSFTISNEVNLILDGAVDVSTRKFLQKILESRSIAYSESESIATGKTNILLGIKGSGEKVDAYFSEKVEYDASIFNGKEDPYVLVADQELEQKGLISILGEDSDAVFYGLATLKMIIEQTSGNEIRSLKVEDFADSKWRGFIEGFYGFPWSHEDRISLMRFGGKIKMNSYIFAPKDDKYHNSAWRTLYPQDELAKVKELVDVGHETKTQFVWAIHPGFSMINWNNYEAELQTLLAKLEQLYGVGVRQFGLFLDDISTTQSLADKEKHVKLVTDVANWAASKGDVKSLIYCPPFYNQAWTGTSGKPYLQALRNVPGNVEIMWTGKDVIGSVNTADNQWVKNEIGRDPYIWFNYPVNGYMKNRLLLGEVPMLEAGTHNFSGIVSNPLEQAELSKVALFGVADYTWNVDDFDAEQSWKNSFQYIEPEAAEEYKTIAYHMSDPSPNGRGVVFDESENIKEQLETFLEAFKKGTSLQEIGEGLTLEFDRILESIQGFKSKIKNDNLLDEIDPWINSLHYVVQSDKYAVEAAVALKDGNMNVAVEALVKATNSMADSKKFTRDVINDKPQTVEAGAKRLVPFASELIQQLDAQISNTLDPNNHSTLPQSSYGVLPDISKMVDGDLNTFVYIQTKQQNGDWYGIDFGKSIQVNDINIIQGRTDTDHDIFQRGQLEYSLDGQNWTKIGEEKSGAYIAETDIDLEARYIRYRLTHAGIPGGKPDLWTAVREFTVNTAKGRAGVYTNVDSLVNSSVTETDVSAKLSGISGITLKPLDYLGLQLSNLEMISDLILDRSSNEAVLEFSENGVEWQNVVQGSGVYPNAAYIRLINKGEEDIHFDLTTLQISYQKFTEPVVSHNYEGVYQGNLSAIFDGKIDGKVWFNGRQTPGRYVKVDMGGIVRVQNAGIVINDGEGDYFRQGDLQLSLDGVNWETIHTFSNPKDISKNFPEHVAPYRYLRVEVDNKPARYIRLYTTVDNAGWLALNEIFVNEGIEKPEMDNPAIQAVPQGKSGNEVAKAIDGQIATFYTQEGDSSSGNLNYKMSRYTELDQIRILQSPSSLSDAKVSIRDTEGWHEAGQLNQTYNIIDTSSFDFVLEMKLEWPSGKKPMIHEIILVPNDGKIPPVDLKLSTELKGHGTVSGGEPFSIQYGIKNVTDSVYAQDVIITYDPSLMELKTVSSLQKGINLLDTSEAAPGKVRLIVVSEGPDHAVKKDMMLLNLDFIAKVVSETITTSVTVSKAVMADGDGIEKEAGPSNIQVEIKADEHPPVNSGDLNGDGKVSIGDLAIAAAHYGKEQNSPDWQTAKRADINNDGKIDIMDLAAIAQNILN